MVTFISQCEKKALPRTRRVLDAFANRIGDRTWQTIITEDGLITVKNLLKKSVTKNSAVSCHWLRSRSRSELVWIVGNRNCFNQQGFVPVNLTSKELFMDIVSEKPRSGEIYANTHLQPLVEHLFAVGYVAEKLYKKLIPSNDDKANAIFVAGCLHDLGKIDPHFQEWVRDPKKKDYIAEDGQHIDNKKFSFETHPRHNEISVLLYQLLDSLNLKSINQETKKLIKHTIYWHHSKPFRKKDKGFETYRNIYTKIINNIKECSFNEFLDKSINLLDSVCNLDKKYRETDQSFLSKVFEKNIDNDSVEALEEEPLPFYKKYDSLDNFEEYQKSIKINANNNIARSCVISADRLISGLSAAELQNYIKNKSIDYLIEDNLIPESNLCSHIESCLSNFPKGERSVKQNEIATQLIDTQDVAVLSGPAGCGKTKIALEWAKLKNAQKIIWICPRVQICQGLFDDLTSSEYLPNAKIEINTGEFKFINKWNSKNPESYYFSGDIVITTIDQILSAITSHSKVDGLIKYLSSHIVFDEFHEYVNMPAFNLLFAELIECKKQQGKFANTLLVSATPHYFYLNKLLEIDKDDIISMPSFNQSKYKIEFRIFDETKQDETNPLYKKQNSSSFVISNTALTAQKSFIQNQSENSILLHSKFKKSDKQKYFDEVFESFKKEGTKKFDILRSGPMVQAALNITCDYMISEMSSAENILQRLGRLDRFGKNIDKVNKMTIAITQNVANGNRVGSSAKFLNSLHSLKSAKAWYQILSGSGDKHFVLTEIYNLYKNFYSSGNAEKLIGEDVIKSLKKSAELINDKIRDPIIIFSKKITNGRAKISKNSLRGENRFVQMAVCDISDSDKIKFCDEYAYQLPINERDEIDNLTEDLGKIKNCGLLEYASKKDLNINLSSPIKDIPANKMMIRQYVLESYARDPEFPIYLSYSPSDLEKVGGKDKRHNEGIYYAVCDKQKIGAISIKYLNSKKE
jgi:CRISPR-associated endonuclease/helicase Cas3